MGLYVYAPSTRKGTQELIDMLKAKRLRRFDGMRFWHKNARLAFTKNDTIVCWGQCLPPIEPQRILNASDKFSNDVDPRMCLNMLMDVSLHVIHPIKGLYKGTPYTHPLDTIQRGDRNKTMHSPDFFGRVVTLIEMGHEYELHVFGDVVIYAKKKTPLRQVVQEKAWQENKTTTSHPWYKSSTTGWTSTTCPLGDISVSMTQIAVLAIKRLGLTFGVVYMGLHPSTTILRKVSIVPELDAEGVELYSKHILKWLEPKGT